MASSSIWRLWVVGFAVVALLAPASATAVTGWSSAGRLAVPRDGATATKLADGRVLVAGGLNREIADYVSSAEVYDPATNGWSATGSMAGPRGEHTATLLPNGKVLVAGGSIRSGMGAVFLSSAELYDPANGGWTSAGSMGQARRGHTATLLPDGRVLVAGGDDQSGASLSSVEIYDPATNGWSAAGSMATSRNGHTATLLPNGKVLAAGGLSGFGSGAVPVSSSEVYDPATNGWAGAASMGAPRALHTATALADGRVLVVGGINGTMGPSTWSSSAEVYDPGANAWSAAGITATPRLGNTTTRLGNGTVLVAGGLAAGGGFLASAELYEPGSNAWSGAPSMAAPRTGHTATLLANGSVLVASGWTETSAELYGELPQCSDRLDNDGDALIDSPADPGCTSPNDTDESNPPVIPPDREAPRAALSGKRVQKLGRTIRITVTCKSTTEDCITTATGRLSLTGSARRFNLKGVRRKVITRRKKVTLRLGVPRKARSAATRALRRRKAVRAKISVRVSDLAANTKTLTWRVRLRR